MKLKTERRACPLPGWWVSRRGRYYGPFPTSQAAFTFLGGLRAREFDPRFKEVGTAFQIDIFEAVAIGGPAEPILLA